MAGILNKCSLDYFGVKVFNYLYRYCLIQSFPKSTTSTCFKLVTEISEGRRNLELKESMVDINLLSLNICRKLRFFSVRQAIIMPCSSIQMPPNRPFPGTWKYKHSFDLRRKDM